MLVPSAQKRTFPAASTIKWHVAKVAKMQWREKAEWILQHTNYWPILVKVVMEQVHDKQIAACRAKHRARKKYMSRDAPRSTDLPSDASTEAMPSDAVLEN